LFRKNIWPSFDDLMLGPIDFTTYWIFCENFLIGVIGTALSEESFFNTALSKFSSISDEAMTFLILCKKMG
jgi:hypothetical protein